MRRQSERTYSVAFSPYQYSTPTLAYPHKYLFMMRICPSEVLQKYIFITVKLDCTSRLLQACTLTMSEAGVLCALTAGVQVTGQYLSVYEIPTLVRQANNNKTRKTTNELKTWNKRGHCGRSAKKRKAIAG